MKKILILGEALIDFLSQEYSDDIENVEIFTKLAGGSPAKIASNLINFGIEPFFITRVGNDPFGRFLINKFKEKKIDTSNIQVDCDHNTSMVFVSKSKESPKFMPVRSADRYIEYNEEFSQLLQNVDFFHISAWTISHEPVRSTVFRIIAETEKTGTKLCFDPNFQIF